MQATVFHCAGSSRSWTFICNVLRSVNPGTPAAILQVHLSLLQEWLAAAASSNQVQVQELMDVVKASIQEQHSKQQATAGYACAHGMVVLLMAEYVHYNFTSP